MASVGYYYRVQPGPNVTAAYVDFTDDFVFFFFSAYHILLLKLF